MELGGGEHGWPLFCNGAAKAASWISQERHSIAPSALGTTASQGFSPGEALHPVKCSVWPSSTVWLAWATWCLLGASAVLAAPEAVEQQSLRQNSIRQGRSSVPNSSASEQHVQRLIRQADELESQNKLGRIPSLLAAAELYERIVKIREASLGPIHPLTLVSLGKLKRLYGRAGELSKLEHLHVRTTSIREKVLGPGHPELASSLCDLGTYYFVRRIRPLEAALLYKRCLKIRENALGLTHAKVAEALDSLADLYAENGRYCEVVGARRRRIVIIEKRNGAQSDELIRELIRLAAAQRMQGQYSDGVATIQRAIGISQARGKTDSLNRVNSILMYLYYDMYFGRSFSPVAGLNAAGGVVDAFDKQQILQQADQILSEAHQRMNVPPTTLTDLGLLRIEQGRIKEAEALFAQALQAIEQPAAELFQVYEGTQKHTEILMYLGLVHGAQGSFDKAEPLLLRSVGLASKTHGPSHPHTARRLEALAHLYGLQSSTDRMQSTLGQSLRIRRDAFGPTHPSTILNSSSLAALAVATGNISGAREMIAAASSGQYRWLVGELPLVPKEQRLTLQADQPDVVALTFALLDRDPGSRQLALETRLNRKGLLQEIEQRQRQVLGGSPRTRELTSRLVGLSHQINRPDLPESDRPALRQERARLEADLYRLLPSLRIDPVSIPQVAAALPANSVLVEFQRYRPLIGIDRGKASWGDARYVALLLFPDQRVLTVSLGPAAAIDGVASRALEATARNLEDPTTLWHQVSERLFSPLQPQLRGVRQVFLSPDGELHRVPFTLLPSPANPKRLLREDLQLRLITTGRDLIRLQSPAKGAGPSVVISNPDFGPGTSWAPLPATEQEGRKVSQILRAGTPLTDRRASEQAVLRLRSPLILHIATHGFFTPQLTGSQVDPLSRSGLVFSGANQAPSDPANDGLLTAAEATGLQLEGTELVVLSACQTGQGDIQNGEGVYGLQRALLVAGSRSALLSLWKVDDYATALFMKDFYSQLQRGKGRADALVATQEHFRTHALRAYRDPHYWAAFQLVGDWRSIRSLPDAADANQRPAGRVRRSNASPAALFDQHQHGQKAAEVGRPAPPATLVSGLCRLPR